MQNWLNQIGKEDLSRNSLKRIKSTISGIFTLAKQLGYFDGVNPVQGTSVNPHAREAEETYAYSLEEINFMLTVFPEPASTAFAVEPSQVCDGAKSKAWSGPISIMAHCGCRAVFGMVVSYPRKPKRARHLSL